MKKINNKTYTVIFYLGIILLIFFSCKSNIKDNKHFISTEEKKITISEYSKFIGGQGQSILSLQYLSKQRFYRYYRERLNAHWNTYKEKTYLPMKNWMKQNVPSAKTSLAFYPFSGADFPSLYTVYPKSKKFIMIGLERTGRVFPLHKMKEAAIAQGLTILNHSLDSFLRESFFYTNRMKKWISANPQLKGIVNNLLAFLVLMDLEPRSIEYLSLNHNGKVIYVRDIKQTQGLKIIFYDKEQKEQKELIYWSVDLANSRYPMKNPSLFLYLDDLPKYKLLLKAASFLLFLDNYSMLKETLLEKSNLIVMDDSGFPIKVLADKWKLKVFGQYQSMIPLFKNRWQDELSQIYQQKEKTNLSFMFGYGPESRIIIAIPKR